MNFVYTCKTNLILCPTMMTFLSRSREAKTLINSPAPRTSNTVDILSSSILGSIGRFISLILKKKYDTLEKPLKKNIFHSFSGDFNKTSYSAIYRRHIKVTDKPESRYRNSSVDQHIHFLISTVGRWPARYDHLAWSESPHSVLKGHDTRFFTSPPRAIE